MSHGSGGAIETFPSNDQEGTRAIARYSTLSCGHMAYLICVKYCNIRCYEQCIILGTMFVVAPVYIRMKYEGRGAEQAMSASLEHSIDIKEEHLKVYLPLQIGSGCYAAGGVDSTGSHSPVIERPHFKRVQTFCAVPFLHLHVTTTTHENTCEREQQPSDASHYNRKQ